MIDRPLIVVDFPKPLHFRWIKALREPLYRTDKLGHLGDRIDGWIREAVRLEYVAPRFLDATWRRASAA